MHVDTNNSNVAVYHENHKNPLKPVRQSETAADLRSDNQNIPPWFVSLLKIEEFTLKRLVRANHL